MSEIPFVATSSDITKTLQCDKFNFLLTKPFARLIPDSIDEHSIVSITVSAEVVESLSDEFFEGIDN